MAQLSEMTGSLSTSFSVISANPTLLHAPKLLEMQAPTCLFFRTHFWSDIGDSDGSRSFFGQTKGGQFQPKSTFLRVIPSARMILRIISCDQPRIDDPTDHPRSRDWGDRALRRAQVSPWANLAQPE